ncbi:MAG: hypothetical protein RL375_1051 [Pseudomonadota bacterium]|jgi:predicted Rossmann fold nucleotide-binding protein DprA/Smf involved in DNA uptake
MTATATASPWDVLLKAQPCRFKVHCPQDADVDAKPGTKLAGLLAELAERDTATTHTLAVCADLEPRQVWGLLKAPRAAGQVRFEAGRWSINRDWAGRDVERAAALLRDLGWTVAPPRAQA